MCGRYILAQQAKLERAIKLGKIRWQFEVSYNVAPTQPVPVVRLEEGERVGLLLRWGLIPYFARGVPPKYSTINAQIERLDSAPAWRGPWKRAQRCIQWAAGFYEWHVNELGQKHPYFIHLADQEVFGFASVWDRSVADDGTAVESCALITLPGNDLMRQVHNTGANPYRMPAILSSSDWEAWLAGSLDEARAALKPYPQEVMVAHQVAAKVNSAKNDGPELIEALPSA